MELTGKVALVTGGGSGLGRASCVALAAAGAIVVVADIVAAAARETVEQILRQDGQADALTGDVSKQSDAQRMVETAIERFGHLDVLVNNAGVESHAPITEFTEEELTLVFGVNVFGPLFMCKYGMPAMAKSGGGAIVNTASAAGLRGRPDMPLYIASKGAVVALTRGLAMDGAPLGIRVNCICPTAFNTPMMQKALAAMDDPGAFFESNRRTIPLGRVGEPEEMAQAVLFLVSDRSSYITGQALLLDGGSLAGLMKW